jgi:hypothetical protein
MNRAMPNRSSDDFGGNRMDQPFRPSLNTYVQSELGGRLRSTHEEVVKEGISDQFAALLRRLDKHSQREAS